MELAPGDRARNYRQRGRGFDWWDHSWRRGGLEFENFAARSVDGDCHGRMALVVLVVFKGPWLAAIDVRSTSAGLARRPAATV